MITELTLMHKCCRIVSDEIHIAIKAIPGTSKTELVVSANDAEKQEDRLRMRIAAAPENGKANAELINFFAKTLGCPKRDIRLLHGEKSRLKTIAVPLEYRKQVEGIFKGE
jgi:uncharacterized protein (TIGR00251 family)